MPKGIFLHIYISPKSGITNEKVEEKMNLGLDWYRYDSNVYIVYTTSDVNKWQNRLQELVNPGGFMFISELNINKDYMNYNGWMAQDFWDWIKARK